MMATCQPTGAIRHLRRRQMTDKLKTCPWCGSEAVMRSHESHLNANPIMYSAMCSEECCECPSGWHKSEKTATKRWNTRVSDDATQQIIKAAVLAIEDVVEGDYGKYTDGDDCSHGKIEAEVCQDCINEHLIPHMQALKGLIYEQV
ncbi:MAG: Lar family restriction alleviation protein [Cytophagales bacterium]|nr:Lar family restriction alleviation protein [Cytophagales bacterium]